MIKRSEELDKLWELHHAAYLQGNGDVYKNKLIEHSLPYVKIIADEIYLGLSPNIQLDDLKQEGIFGAIEAIKSFNPKKARFVTYLDKKVRSKILDYIRNEDLVSRVVRARFYQLEKAKSKLKEELGYEPTRKQLIKELSKDIYPTNPILTKNYNKKTKFKGRKKAQKIVNDAKSLKKRVYFFGLNSNEEEEEDRGQIDLPEDKKASNPLYEAQKKDFKDFLLRGLTREEKLILNLYYSNYEKAKRRENWNGMPQWKIGKLLGLTQSGVSQIHSTLLPRLKDKLTARGMSLEACLNNL